MAKNIHWLRDLLSKNALAYLTSFLMTAKKFFFNIDTERIKIVGNLLFKSFKETFFFFLSNFVPHARFSCCGAVPFCLKASRLLANASITRPFRPQLNLYLFILMRLMH